MKAALVALCVSVQAELRAGMGPFAIANRHGLSLRQIAEIREVAK
jgi:hypothetical protein